PGDLAIVAAAVVAPGMAGLDERGRGDPAVLFQIAGEGGEHAGNAVVASHQPGLPQAVDDVFAHPGRGTAGVGCGVVLVAFVPLPAVSPGAVGGFAIGIVALVVEQPADALVQAAAVFGLA